MKFTLSWLKQLLDKAANADEIALALNAIGFEVEGLEDKSAIYSPFVIAEIKEVSRHPDAEKLNVCQVNNGKEILQIVCGADNARAGIKVVLAPVGAMIPANSMLIKASKIRGIESNGMLCSAYELLLGTDAEGIIELGSDAAVGTKYASYANLNDVVFDIALTANRGDGASVYGIARDLAAKGIGTLRPLTSPIPKYIESESPITIRIEDVDGCSAFTGTYIAGVNNFPGTNVYANALKGVGNTPKTPLVDISNFAMLNYGRPNHVYDADKITGDVVIRKSRAGEQFVAIGGQEYELPEGLMVIADSAMVLCVAGVIGGELSKVTEATKNILVEVADFNPIAVTNAGRALNQHTDSRFRFERGIDHGNTDFFTNYLNSIILSTCGGQATSRQMVTASTPNFITEVKFDFDNVKALGGIDIAEGTAREILKRLGFFWEGSTVKIPTWRQGGIDGAADIVEEILRIYGFDFIPSEPLPLSQANIIPGRVDLENAMRHALTQRGMDEVLSWSFMDESLARKFGHDDHIKLANPISVELNVMRKTAIPNLMSFIGKNCARGYANLAFFEMGSIYAREHKDNQMKCLTGLRSGKINARSVHKDEREVSFYDAKADLYAAVAAYQFDADKLTVSRNVPSYYHPGRSACLTLGKNIIGYCGEIHPEIINHYDLNCQVVGFELLFHNLPLPKSIIKRTKLDISDYQVVVRDFAFIVADSIAVTEILKAAKSVNPMIESAEVFDVYAGKGIEKGMKSVAITIRIQPRLKTLSDEEINTIAEGIINTAANKFEAILR